MTDNRRADDLPPSLDASEEHEKRPTSPEAASPTGPEAVSTPPTLMPTLVVRAGPPLLEGEARPTADWGRYTLSGEIARGGMGIVLRGHDGRLNRELAVKV